MAKAWVVGLVLVAPLVLASANGASADASAFASSWWNTTLLDADRDHVDDALAATLTTARDPLVVLVDYASMPTPDERAALAARCAIVNEYANFPTVAARCAPTTVRSVLQLPGVVFVEQNDVLVPLLKESVVLIGADQAWTKYKATGKGVAIAILDDGAFEQHPDLKDKIVADFDAGAPATLPFESPVPIGLVSPAGEEGHGTHVAGIAAGPGLQSGGTYRGVAPDATLVNVKVFSGPNQTTVDIVLRGLDWTLAHMAQFKIRTATMSLGGRASDGKDALSRAVDLAVDKGLVVVAAAGNTGPGPKTITIPGAAAKAITVGAVDKQRRIAAFSSRGPTLDGRTKPDIVAPGVGITSTIPPASTPTVAGLASGNPLVWYGALSGTSMATPHVAGVVALMLQVNPSLSPQQVKEILLVTAQENGKPGIDNDTGFGFVNAVAAVQVAKDPTILQQPQYKSRLAAVPDPPPESTLAKLNFAAEKLQRDPNFLLYVGSGVLAVVAAVAVVTIVLVKRKRPPGAP